MERLLIRGGTLINEGERFEGYVIVSGDRIETVGRSPYPYERFDGTEIDARGQWVLPGAIDDQVHFREPGLTYKADIRSESVAAAAGGVTSFMDMPNVKPPTVTGERLEEKFARAAETSVTNYSFYLGATNDNLDEIRRIDPARVCGVKLFMGSSTGNMLVNDDAALRAVFAESPVLVATHCEDEATVRAGMEKYAALYGDKLTAAMHPLIRSAEACYRSSARAVELATRYGADLHVLHLSTARELDLFDAGKPLGEKRITNEVCVHHLWFSDNDYASKGNFIKWNPAVKTETDREALRQGIVNGKADMVATDHAPHTLEEKQRPYREAPSGGPLVQHSLVRDARTQRPGHLSGRESRGEDVPCPGRPVPRIAEGISARGLFRRHRTGAPRRGMDRRSRQYPVQMRLVALRRSPVLASRHTHPHQRPYRLLRRENGPLVPGQSPRLRPITYRDVPALSPIFRPDRSSRPRFCIGTAAEPGLRPAISSCCDPETEKNGPHRSRCDRKRTNRNPDRDTGIGNIRPPGRAYIRTETPYGRSPAEVCPGNRRRYASPHRQPLPVLLFPPIPRSPAPNGFPETKPVTANDIGRKRKTRAAIPTARKHSSRRQPAETWKYIRCDFPRQGIRLLQKIETG